MSRLIENFAVRLLRLFGFSGSKAAVAPVLLAEQVVACEEVLPAIIEVGVLPVFAAEPVVEAVVEAVRRAPQFMFALRLRYVGKVQRWKNGKKPKPVGKARANLKPKPVVVGKVAKKRGPSLFPAKMKPVTAKKPTTRIYIEKKPKKTAEIVKFPVRKPMLGAPRLKRAA